jgi:hypothetical protein
VPRFELFRKSAYIASSIIIIIIKADFQGIAETQARKQIAEMEERNKRKTNLPIFGLAEVKEGTPDYRKGKDKESVQKILEEIKAKQAPTDMRRLGAPPKQNNEGQENEREKCRPLTHFSVRNRTG